MSSLTIQLQHPCILMLLEYAASNKLDLLLIPRGIEICEGIGRILRRKWAGRQALAIGWSKGGMEGKGSDPNEKILRERGVWAARAS